MKTSYKSRFADGAFKTVHNIQFTLCRSSGLASVKPQSAQ